MVDLVLFAVAVCMLGFLLAGRYTLNPELAEFETRVIRESHLRRLEAYAAEQRARFWMDDVQAEIATQDLLALAEATREEAEEAAEVLEAVEVLKAGRSSDSVSA